MGTGHPAWVVAYQLLWMRKDTETTPLQLIKLVFLCHGWMLALHNKPLIHEPVEAWKYGPVVPSIYHGFKYFRSDPIAVDTMGLERYLADEELETIDRVNLSYSDYSGTDLSGITHQRGTPWDQTVRARGVGSVIENSTIRDFYCNLLESAKAHS